MATRSKITSDCLCRHHTSALLIHASCFYRCNGDGWNVHTLGCFLLNEKDGPEEEETHEWTGSKNKDREEEGTLVLVQFNSQSMFTLGNNVAATVTIGNLPLSVLTQAALFNWNVWIETWVEKNFFISYETSKLPIVTFSFTLSSHFIAHSFTSTLWHVLVVGAAVIGFIIESVERE